MSKAYQRKSDFKSLCHHGLIHIILEHEWAKYHISWERFLSKIQLTDDKHLRNYSIDCEKKPLPTELKEDDRDVLVEPENNLEQPESREQLSPDFPELGKRKIDIDIVNFASKINARVSSRMTRNQSKK